MFVETKREGEAQSREPSVAGFIKWLEKQSPDAHYNYFAARGCAWNQYSGLYEPFLAPHINQIVCPVPWTFGAALRRARAMAGR